MTFRATIQKVELAKVQNEPGFSVTLKGSNIEMTVQIKASEADPNLRVGDEMEVGGRKVRERGAP